MILKSTYVSFKQKYGTSDKTKSVNILKLKFLFFFFLHTLFQFGFTIAPIQKTGLINVKYNNILCGTKNTIINYIVQ